MSAAVLEYLEAQHKAAQPGVQEHYAQLAEFYRAKKWHQLTEQIEALINLPQVQNEQLPQLYTRFIKDFEGKINNLSLVKIIIALSRQIRDPQAALDFVQNISEKQQVKGDVEAHILVLSVLAGMRLRAGQLEQCKEILETAKTRLEGVAGVDAIVHAAYYKVWSDFNKAQNSPVEFYKSALTYLTYANLEHIPANEQMALAFDLGIAALIGESIYNFGELLGNDILKSLQGGPADWLVQLLRVFNSGDIHGYENVVTKYREQLSQQQALAANDKLLAQKISILALMELAFKRPSDQRTVPFADVAAASKLPLNEVEPLVMKALSLKLVRGTIDEVDQTFSVTWVQPRVLDIPQIATMKDRLQDWTKKVQTTLGFMEDEVSTEIFA
jgi:26S proteasome regulatory subunit N9